MAIRRLDTVKGGCLPGMQCSNSVYGLAVPSLGDEWFHRDTPPHLRTRFDTLTILRDNPSQSKLPRAIMSQKTLFGANSFFVRVVNFNSNEPGGFRDQNRHTPCRHTPCRRLHSWQRLTTHTRRSFNSLGLIHTQSHNRPHVINTLLN